MKWVRLIPWGEYIYLCTVFLGLIMGGVCIIIGYWLVRRSFLIEWFTETTQN